MKTMIAIFSCLALASPALAQSTAPPQAPSPSGFSGLFTSWSDTARESLRAETEAARLPAAGAIPASTGLQRGQGEAQAVALGERVADFVRRGDCEAGERIAREAGDFALVRAVRGHCRNGEAASR
ncbi:MAG TPA: hypothetical protein VES64_01950 [Allosphingosinicella sp.]|nr:hypothetical protein [Allosphingosinicella sp.]